MSAAGAIVQGITGVAGIAGSVGGNMAATNKTNETNLQIAREVNQQNAQNVAATNAANVQMNESTNQANYNINQATNAANLQMNAATNQANLDIANATNKANAEIAQMNNEYNEQMLERQIENEWNMWNAENEYNTPAAQMQRQREAGLNPYVAANSGSISSGNAGSMTLPGAQPAAGYTAQGATMVAPTLQPTSLTPGHVDAAQAQMVGVSAPDLSALDGIRGVVGSVLDIQDRQAQIENQNLRNDQVKIENKYLAQRLLADIANTYADTDSKKMKTNLDRIQQNYMDEIYKTDLRQKNQEIFFRKLQSTGQLISNLSSLQWYKVLPQQIQQTLNEQAVRINNMKESGRLTAAQVRTEVHKAMLMFQQYGFNEKMNPKQLRLIEEQITHAINNSGPEGGQGLLNVGWQALQQIKDFFK